MKTRKELKEEYKLIKHRMGVFQIRNKTNDKIFIDNSLNLDAIWHSQRLQLETGTHQNEQLQKDWKTTGADNFAYEILEEIEHRDDKPVDYKQEIKILKDIWLDKLKPYGDKGYH